VDPRQEEEEKKGKMKRYLFQWSQPLVRDFLKGFHSTTSA
jgi:hypothetical protein